MTASLIPCVLAAAMLCAVGASHIPELSWCEAPARTTGGWVCGEQRRASSGAAYASFLGVPYAKQPLGELRFQELQPLEPWQDVLNATAEGPVCPQTDVLYKELMQAKGGMGEDCIHANVHVPLDALPAPGADEAGASKSILVFIHGGGFAFGSGDTDLHGPEYLVSKDVIIITFNYRLNIFGFLSLNSTEVPGNNGLRDAIALLRWVQQNARYFGGDPRDVTIAGQSAGAVMAHMLTLSPAARGLFKKAILMSGTASGDFFSSSPQFASIVADLLLNSLGLDRSLPSEELHKRLVSTPLETLMQANKALIDIFGLTTFVPVVESSHPGVTNILPEEPEEMIRRGYGSDIPLLVGFTSAECETFRPRFQELDIAAKLNATPVIAIPPRMTYLANPSSIPTLLAALQARYLRGDAEDGFVRLCSDADYAYPALRLVALRAAAGAPTHLYKFSYGGQRSAIKESLGLRFAGAGHIEDLTYALRPRAARATRDTRDTRASRNTRASRPRPRLADDAKMVHLMTNYIVNFMNSTADATPRGLWHQSISGPRAFRLRPLEERDLDTMRFFDDLYDIALH